METPNKKPLVFAYGGYAGLSDQDSLSLLAAEPAGQLSLWNAEGERPEMVFMHYALPPCGGAIWGHLANSNPALALLADRPRGTFWVNGPSAYIPSHWTGADRAVPTSYYSWAQFEVTVELVRGAEGILEILQLMLERLQPEGNHPPVDPQDQFWQGMLQAITGVTMRIESCRSRHKYGQNRPPATRREIAALLRARDQGRDGEVAAAVEAHLAEGVNPG